MWLIIDNKELEDREKPDSSHYDYWGQTSQIEAYCLYSGPKADWWKAGQNDTWFVDMIGIRKQITFLPNGRQ